MPSWIENKVAYLNGAKIGVGDNYINISNAGVLSFHGTAKIDDSSDTSDIFKGITIQYDDDNKMVFTTSSVGAGKIAMTGSSDSFEIETGDGKIVLDAGTDIDIDPAGNDINLLGDGAGKITMATTSMTIYGGDTTGDVLTLQGNSADATEKITITGNTGIDIGGTLTLDKVSWEGFLSGAAAASGLLLGVGTTANPATTSTADAKFVELRCQTTATSGDNRLMYLRYDQNGAGGGGECLRAFTKATAALGTARGAQISLDVDAAGSVTGLGVGLDGQLAINDALPAGGTYFATQSEMYMAATADVSAVTSHAIHSIIANGDGTAVATVKHALAFKGAEGTGNMIYNNNSSGATESNGSIAILVDEGSGYVTRYLRYWDAENS